MKTYISEIIPSLQRFSEKLDNLTLLTNQHWVVLDDLENAKTIYIFRKNNDLLISTNGKVEKAKWEYLGNNSILIEKKDETYLFKHGFFDENVLALKIDNKNEYAILINENKYEGEINSIESAINFLSNKYNKKNIENTYLNQPYLKKDLGNDSKIYTESYSTKKGIIRVILKDKFSYPEISNKVFLNDDIAPNGKYQLDILWYIHVENGIITKTSLF